MRLLIVLFFAGQALMAQTGLWRMESELQDSLDAIRSKQGFPGLCVSVVFNDDNALKLSSGHVTTDRLKVLSPEAQLLSGSTGKMFFSAVILKLIESGKLSLDDKSSKYLSDFEWYHTFPNSEHITIKQLMNHTTGLPRHIFQESFLNELRDDPTKDRDPVDCIQSISNTDPVHPAGEGWGYSDTNYILLGLIFEKITGQKIYDVVKQEVIIPAGLELTKASNDRRLSGLVQGHIGSTNPFGLPSKAIADDGLLYIHPAFEWTGGGYVTNAYDLAKLLLYIHESDYLSQESKANLVTPVDMKTGKQSNAGYGLGSFVWDRNGEKSYGHSGFFPGYLSYALYFPEQQFAIAIQINHDGYGSSLQEIANVVKTVVEKHLD